MDNFLGLIGKNGGLSLPNEMQVSEACFPVYETLNSLDYELNYGG